jgi:hypothetical protein
MTFRRLSPSYLRALRSVAAAFLVAVAVGDLATDADCDPLPSASGGVVVTAATDCDSDADACAAGCIPDCFCCARSLAAGPRVAPPAPFGVAAVAAIGTPVLPPGFSFRSEHPPRARA